MAKKVTRYIADDGSEWETMELAQRQDEVNKISTLIEHMTVYGNVDPNELLTALVVGSLGDAVVAFRQRYPN